MFANKVVLITGGSSGIGAATAKCFAKEGASVAIVGRNSAKLKDVAKICEKFGAKVLIIKADISKDAEAKTIIKETIERFGKLDVLVNNAAIIKYVNFLDNSVMDVYDEIMNTNLRAAVQITHLALPYIKETKGNIINVSSISSSNVTMPGMISYNISKAGLDHFTRSAALDFAPFGVRVNSINPGAVNTEMAQAGKLPEELMEKLSDITKIVPLGRAAEPEEVGDLILYLASDKAKSITGSFFAIDNGGLLKKLF